MVTNNVLRFVRCRDENHLYSNLLFSQVYRVACDLYTDADVTDTSCVFKYLVKDLGFPEDTASALEHPIVLLGRKREGLW